MTRNDQAYRIRMHYLSNRTARLFVPSAPSQFAVTDPFSEADFDQLRQYPIGESTAGGRLRNEAVSWNSDLGHVGWRLEVALKPSDHDGCRFVEIFGRLFDRDVAIGAGVGEIARLELQRMHAGGARLKMHETQRTFDDGCRNWRVAEYGKLQHSENENVSFHIQMEIKDILLG